MKKPLLALSLATLSLSAFAQNGVIKIYDAKLVPQIVNIFKPGRLVLENGERKALLVPRAAEDLNENLEKVRDYFSQELNRNSWDGKGAEILASVNVNRFTIIDILGTRQNAAWVQNRFVFGAGKKDGLDEFEKALDVVGHEFTHAVIQTSSNLKYEGQSGALNEHLADVFGVLINQKHNRPKNPYLIGATVLHGEYAEKAQALRDLMDPSKGLSPQPGHMRDLKTDRFKVFDESCKPTRDNDNCGVHVLSGIPNRMAALVMSAIGPEQSADLFYNVMTKRLKETSNFKDYRLALMQECQNLSSDVCAVVDDALKSVGL